MPELFAPSIDDQIECIRRELGYRHKVYARRVESGQMTARLAEREIARMEAVHDTLRSIKQNDIDVPKFEC